MSIAKDPPPANAKKRTFGLAPHPLAGGTFGNWVRILRRYGGSIEGRNRWRVAGISLATASSLPLRGIESLRYGRAIAREALDPPPVFIIGHWRSGTTHLHNLMLQDPQWGYVPLLHCVVPTMSLTFRRPLGWLVGRWVPDRRPMDNVPNGLDKPMSEDFALVGWSDMTHYLGYFFPQQLEETFRRTVLFEGVSDRDRRRWGEDYVRVLKKAAIASGGKRLLLKNPPSTARIRETLRLFPDAKFVHVRRDPFRVYASTCKLMRKFLDRFAFQGYDPRQVDEAVLRRYRLLMERYDAEKHLIPPGNLVEVAYEDVVADPVGSVERIYAELGLPGFDDARSPLVEYADSIRDYRTNDYEFGPERVAAIREEIGFLIDRWGYADPEPAAEPAPVLEPA